MSRTPTYSYAQLCRGRPAIQVPSLSALAARQGNIIPGQLWKHGSGSYPLDISGETVPSLQVLLTDLLCQADVLWFIISIVVLLIHGSRQEGERGQQMVPLLGPLIDWAEGNVVAPDKERDRILAGL